MSQPRSGCSTWSDNLIRLREGLQGLDTQQAAATAIDREASAIPQQDDHPSGVDEEMPFENLNQEHLRLPRLSSDADYFPGAAQTFDGGRTFVDKFHADEFNNHRTSNIYYPFAFRGDWEMASWLLRSRLSMNAIDSFLSLDLVRTSQESRVSTIHRAIRLKLLVSHSILRRSSESEPNYFQAVLAGCRVRSPRCIPRNVRSFCIGAIH